MSKLSIYETSWINLVFENRNKEYGAYQLRQEYAKSSFKALFTGIFLVTALGLLSKLSWSVSNHSEIQEPIPFVIDEPIKVTEVFINQQKSQNLPVVNTQNETPPISKSNLVNPVIVSSSVEVPEIATNKEMVNQTTEPTSGTGTITGHYGSISGNGAVLNEPKDNGNTIVASNSLDKLPEFPGGIAKFYSYVGNNFEKPEMELSQSIRVIVNFIIEKDGSMTSIQVKSDPGFGIGNEAVRVLKSLKTKWLPGMVNSKAVRTAYSLPITVQLE
jgi:Gram-negative bacterial TonB protein C-terminal